MTRHTTEAPAALVAAILAVTALFTATGAAATDAPPPDPAREILVQGKLFCSLRHAIPFPYSCTITNVPIQVGQRVQVADTLVAFDLSHRAVLDILRRLSAANTEEADVALAVAMQDLAAAEARRSELQQLAHREMASADQLDEAARRVDVLSKRAAAASRHAETRRQEDREIRLSLQKTLGIEVSAQHLPRRAVLSSPIDGRVISIHHTVRPGASPNAGDPGVIVGTMDPMQIRTQLHELDAARLRPGDIADVTLDVLPGRTFKARLTRIAWTAPFRRYEDPTYYEAVLEIENPENLLREGYKVNLTLRAHD